MGKILVVDDDETVLFMLAEVLREFGHEVVTASHASGALSLLDGIDAALVDARLRGTSGLTLISSIRERHATLPVVLLTADTALHSDAAVQALTFGVMAKPVDIDDLSSMLDRALQVPPSDG